MQWRNCRPGWYSRVARSTCGGRARGVLALVIGSGSERTSHSTPKFVSRTMPTRAATSSHHVGQGRDPAQLADPERAEGDEPLEQGVVVGEDVRPVERRRHPGRRRVPHRPLVVGVGRRAVVAMGAQPARVVAAAVSVDRPHHVQLTVAGDRRRAGRVLDRCGDQLVGLLLGDRVDALVARAVVAEPDVVEAGRRAVRPPDLDPSFGVDRSVHPRRCPDRRRSRASGSREHHFVGVGGSRSAACRRAIASCTPAPASVSTVSRWADLDDATVGHHGDPVGDRPHERQVVGDEQHRQPEVTLQRRPAAPRSRPGPARRGRT